MKRLKPARNRNLMQRIPSFAERIGPCQTGPLMQSDMRKWRWFDWLVYLGIAAAGLAWLCWYGAAFLGMG